MRKIAVFGSRSWQDMDAIERAITLESFDNGGDWVLVTTEAKGVCEHASEYAISLGLPVIVFKPVKISDSDKEDVYAVDEWRISPSGSSIVHHHDPDWADWQSAMNWRSTLMAERAERAYAFQHQKSRGTQFEIDLFRMYYEKSCEVTEA